MSWTVFGLLVLLVCDICLTVIKQIPLFVGIVLGVLLVLALGSFGGVF